MALYSIQSFKYCIWFVLIIFLIHGSCNFTTICDTVTIYLPMGGSRISKTERQSQGVCQPTFWPKFPKKGTKMKTIGEKEGVRMQNVTI